MICGNLIPHRSVAYSQHNLIPRKHRSVAYESSLHYYITYYIVNTTVSERAQTFDFVFCRRLEQALTYLR